MEAAAYVAIGLLAVLTVFQAALALGAPWGAGAWGGRHPGVLPLGHRIASAAAIVVYALIGLVVADAAGLIEVFGSIPGWLLWALVGFFGLGTLANLASRSKVERIWAPVSAVLAFCVAIVAAGS
jgi:hypothetical protein